MFNRYIYISVLFYSSMVVVRDVIVRFILLSALLLLFSCSSPEGVGDDLVDSVNVEDGGEVIDVSDKEKKDDSDIVPTINVTASTKVELQNTTCVSEWICLSAKSKIYREANCSFTKREDCKFGCKNNTCGQAPVCTAGWNCDGNHYRGYRLESCEFTKKEKCEFGCKDAVCLAEPVVNTTVDDENAQTSGAGSAVATPAWSTISSGETVVISNHNVSIYTMSDTVVMLIVDGKKSDWLKEGDTFKRNGFSLVIEEILFQSYKDGLKQVSYSVG